MDMRSWKNKLSRKQICVYYVFSIFVLWIQSNPLYFWFFIGIIFILILWFHTDKYWWQQQSMSFIVELKNALSNKTNKSLSVRQRENGVKYSRRDSFPFPTVNIPACVIRIEWARITRNNVGRWYYKWFRVIGSGRVGAFSIQLHFCALLRTPDVFRLISTLFREAGKLINIDPDITKRSS